MRLATTVNQDAGPQALATRVGDLERAGIDVFWVGEAYGFDSPSVLGFVAAHTIRAELGTGILNVFSRTPAVLAMTGASLDSLTGGRFILGLGSSGPAVVEGLHGMPYDRPLTRAREVIDICRRAWSRDAVVNEGVLPIPLPTGAGTGLGRALKLSAKPVRDTVPIYLASLGARGVELAAQRADGWIPLFFVPEKADIVWGAALRRGTATRDPARAALEVVAGGLVAFTDDADHARRVRDSLRPMVALYMGGMGPKNGNYYNGLMRSYGYERAADEIQDLYLSGQRDLAAAAVPDELIALTTLVGSVGHVRDRLAAFREAGVTCMSVELPVGDEVATVERLRALVDE